MYFSNQHVYAEILTLAHAMHDDHKLSIQHMHKRPSIYTYYVVSHALDGNHPTVYIVAIDLLTKYPLLMDFL